MCTEEFGVFSQPSCELTALFYAISLTQMTESRLNSESACRRRSCIISSVELCCEIVKDSQSVYTTDLFTDMPQLFIK